MSTAVEVVGRNDDLSTVEALMAAKKLRHIPVVEDGELVGLVSQRELFKAMMSPPWDMGKKPRNHTPQRASEGDHDRPCSHHHA